MEDPGKQLVEVQRRAELEADRVDQPKAGYLIPELFNGAFGGADDVGHGIGTCEDVLSCSVKTICTRRPVRTR